MAENTPNPLGGGIPPRPADAAKVQPKKETVRINLPPKPTSSATIKLPTLPPGGAPAAPSPAMPSVTKPAALSPSAVPPPPTPGAPKPPAAGAPGSRVAAAPAKPAVAPSAVAPASAAAARRPAAAPASASIGGVDKGLAIAAALISVVALGSVVYLGWFLTNQPAG